MDTATWVVGPEYDEALFEELRRALKALGFEVKKKWGGVGGSQQVDCWVAESKYGKLEIEAETYVGLVLFGERRLIDGVRAEFQQKAKR